MLTSQTTDQLVAFDRSLAAVVAKGIGIAAVVSIVTLILLYSGLPLFGPVNDLTNAVSGMLTALLALWLHGLVRGGARRVSLVLLVAAWLGSGAIIVNSVLVAFGAMHWLVGAVYSALGIGLQGVWLLGTLWLLAGQPFLRRGLRWLGAVAGSAMLFGLLAGPQLAARLDLANDPSLGMPYLVAAAGWLLYPLWCWLVGRRLAGSGIEEGQAASEPAGSIASKGKVG